MEGTKLLDCARIAREYGTPATSKAETIRLSYGEPGHSVYVLDCDHAVKVGITKSVVGRMSDIETATGFTPVLFRSWRLATHDEAFRVERGAHYILRETRTKGEWFLCHPVEAADAVENCIRKGPPLESYLTAGEAASVRTVLAKRGRVAA